MRQQSISIILSILLFASCSGTKHLPAGENLYIGTKSIKIEKGANAENWKLNNANVKKSNVYLNLWDLPNGSLGFPFFRSIPFRLIFYNWFYTEKEKGFSKWMENNFGQPPITISTINPAKKVEKIKNLFENWGHFGTTGEFEIHYSKKRPKASIRYKFIIPQAYSYRNIEYISESMPTTFSNVFNKYRTIAKINSGEDFNLDVIKDEKIRLLNFFHNNGYYYLQSEDINVIADTTIGNKKLDLKIIIAEDLPKNYYEQERLFSETIQIDSIIQDAKEEKFYSWNSGIIKKKILDSLVKFSNGDIYSYSNVRTSIRNLSDIGIFAEPTILFQPDKNDSLKLNTFISLKSIDATSVGFNVKANYKNIGYVGPSAGVNFTQLNLFKSAINLSVDIDAYYDFPIGVFKNEISRSSGLTMNATFTAPLFNTPLNLITQTYALPKKFLSLKSEFDDRKDYFQLVSWNASTGITWKSSPKISHRLTLLDATFSNISNTTVKFDSLSAENPSLKASLTDQFILGTNYIFKYDNLSLNKKNVGFYFEGKAELDGNILAALPSKKSDAGVKEPLGVPFSQLAQISYDFRTYFKLGEKSLLAFRHIGGIGIAYGNSNQMPYIRQFFIGGSNSLRPISARSVGPGRYLEFKDGEVNQVGDIKIEWNLEYRLKLGPKIHVAVWTDIGNIWLIEEDPYRPNSAIRWNKIFEDSYLTGGLGLRYDLGFMIARLDYGAILYTPPLEKGERWIWENRLKLYGAVIGFGLPF